MGAPLSSTSHPKGPRSNSRGLFPAVAKKTQEILRGRGGEKERKNRFAMAILRSKRSIATPLINGNDRGPPFLH